MDSKGQAGETLKTFRRDFGIPEHLLFDDFQEQCGKTTDVMKHNRNNDITHYISENGYHNQNPVWKELYVNYKANGIELCYQIPL